MGAKFRFKPAFQLSQLRSLSSSSLSFSSITHQRSPFGVAFGIDGVILRGRNPIGNSPAALRRLYDDSGTLKIPFLFLTNGGGIPESRRALELSELLGVRISPSQIVQGYSPFRGLLKRFENEFVVATGKGEPAAVMSEYGFKNVISLEEYASYFDDIDPEAQYKSWKTQQELKKPNSAKSSGRFNISSEKIKAAFIASDPADWGRDIQAAFPSERLGMGAFRIALESVLNRWRMVSRAVETLYMIGDNPPVDIKGARQAGHPWFSILTWTGVFRQTENHTEYPADLVVDIVEEVVEYIIRREGMV